MCCYNDVYYKELWHNMQEHLFEPIAGITGRYESNLELILSGPPHAIIYARNQLTVVNHPVLQEKRRLMNMRPRGAQHFQIIQSQLRALEGQETIKLYADCEEGLSVPPGFYYLCENLKNYEPPKITPKWVGCERYYQKEAIEALLSQNRAFIQLATGSGKSLLTRILCKTFVAMGLRVAVIVPSIELLKQTYKAVSRDETYLVSMLGDGKTPALGCNVLVSTAQSALSEIDKYDVVVLDEAHHSASNSWQEFCACAVGAKFMYCLTASPYRADKLDMLLWAFGGKIVYQYLPPQAIKDGYIVPMDYHRVIVDVPISIKPGTHFSKEYEKLHSHENYIKKAADFVRKSLAKNKKTLVLFRSVKCCKALANELGVESANGEYRKPFYDFQNGLTELCIANVNLLGEGIDVPTIGSLIYCAGGASDVGIIQAFGRALRPAEGKDKAVVIDLVPDNDRWVSFSHKRAEIAVSYKKPVDI
jgi:superfamily II DNA or RNA helicase